MQWTSKETIVQKYLRFHTFERNEHFRVSDRVGRCRFRSALKKAHGNGEYQANAPTAPPREKVNRSKKRLSLLLE